MVHERDYRDVFKAWKVARLKEQLGGLVETFH
jgi:hypothetical protein